MASDLPRGRRADTIKDILMVSLGWRAPLPHRGRDPRRRRTSPTWLCWTPSVSERLSTGAPEETTMCADSHPVVLINPFEVPPDRDREFVTRWERARDFLAGREGYVGTTLHRSLAPDAEFRFVNIAAWPSAAAFQAAIDDPAFREATAEISGRAHPSLYEVARR